MSVSVVFARALVAEFEARGLDAQMLLEESHINPSRLSDVRDKLQADELTRLTQNALTLSDDPAIGLALGVHVPLNAMHLVSYLMLSQRTIRDAFAAFSRYSGLISEGPTFQMIEEGDTATWAYFSSLPPSDTARVLADSCVVMAARIGRQLRPPGEPDRSRLTAVHFRHEAPSYADKYREIFHCPVVFGQSLNGLVFPRAILDHEQSHADQTVDTLLRESAERLLRESTHVMSWSDRTRAVLRYRNNLGEVTLESVAAALKVSTRGLSRRLRAEDMTFSRLLDEARCRIACEQLGREDVTFQEVTDLLGFSEASAFFRAFKRWTGCTPLEYRQRERRSRSAPPSPELAR